MATRAFAPGDLLRSEEYGRLEEEQERIGPIIQGSSSKLQEHYKARRGQPMAMAAVGCLVERPSLTGQCGRVSNVAREGRRLENRGLAISHGSRAAVQE